jgi:hypothetical protein
VTDLGVGHDSEWRHDEGWSVAQPGRACGQGHDTGGARLGKKGCAGALLGQRRVAFDGTEAAVRGEGWRMRGVGFLERWELVLPRWELVLRRLSHVQTGVMGRMPVENHYHFVIGTIGFVAIIMVSGL